MYKIDIKQLVSDRELKTHEIHTSNDFYGNASIFKKYVNMPHNYPLKMVIPHGPLFPTATFWEVDLNSHLPVAIVSSEAAQNSWQKQKPDQLIYTCGPLIAYARPIYSQDEILEIKDKIGKNLLVFHAHSTHHVTAHYDEQWMIDRILEAGREFNSITICIYWKDCTEERIKRFKSNGFMCTTAGHIYDRLFMNRLTSYFALCDAALTFSYSSAAIYAAHFKKPLMILPPKDLHHTFSREEFNRDYNTKHMREVIEKNFREFNQLSKVQYDLLDLIGGFTQVKSKEEMRNIVLESEELYNQRK